MEETAVRFWQAEIRAVDRTIKGRIPYMSPSHDLGGFTEVLSPGCFSDSLEGTVKAFWNHDTSTVLGSTKSGTLRIRDTSTALTYEIDVPKSRDDILESVRRGDVDGTSFGFIVPKGGDTWRGDVRTINEATLLEVSPTSMPAYPATSLRNQNTEKDNEENRMRQAQSIRRAEEFFASDRTLSPVAFFRAVKRAGVYINGDGSYAPTLEDNVHPVLRASGLNGDTLSEGGFAVPKGWIGRMLNGRFASQIFPRCSIFPVEQRSVDLPLLDDSDRSNGSLYQNLSVYWLTGEGDQIPSSYASLRENSFRLPRVAALCPCTNDLLNDMAAGESWLFSEMGKAISWELDKQIILGPNFQGLLQSNAKVVVDKEGGQGADTIVLANIAKMISRLSPESFSSQGTCWLMNQTVFDELLQMFLPVGVAGGSVENLFTFRWAQGEGATFASLCGFPIVVSEHCPVLGNMGDIILADLSHYVILAMGEDRQISGHVLFLTAESLFRIILRCQGQLDAARPVTTFHGGDVVSPVVVLEER
jgi:HK97 family phage major capsid protein